MEIEMPTPESLDPFRVRRRKTSDMDIEIAQLMVFLSDQEPMNSADNYEVSSFPVTKSSKTTRETSIIKINTGFTNVDSKSENNFFSQKSLFRSTENLLMDLNIKSDSGVKKQKRQHVHSGVQSMQSSPPRRDSPMSSPQQSPTSLEPSPNQSADFFQKFVPQAYYVQPSGVYPNQNYPQFYMMPGNEKRGGSSTSQNIQTKKVSAPSGLPCPNCATTTSTLWRNCEIKGVSKYLCNACGLRFKKGKYCPCCFKVYYDADTNHLNWEQCQCCLNWTHKSCLQKQGSNFMWMGYTCNLCLSNTPKTANNNNNNQSPHLVSQKFDGGMNSKDHSHPHGVGRI